MDNIVWLSRHKDDGISIQRVFEILKPYICKSFKVVDITMSNPGFGIKQITQNLIKAFKFRNKGKVIHITGALHYLSYVLNKNKTVTTVHDLGFMQSGGRLAKFIKKIIFINSLKRNKYIVAISEATKKDILSYIKYPEKNIALIPDPISPTFTYNPKEFNEIKPRILHIGTKENKNLRRTIEALQGLNVHLDIIGNLNEELLNLLNSCQLEYSNSGRISDKEILEEYKKCDIVNFPSTFEGFGMPIIEAQAIGRICLTSNIEPMKSVAGESGAFFVDPFNIESIREGYKTVIKDKSLREKIIQQGLINAEKYKAENIAKAYIKLYTKF